MIDANELRIGNWYIPTDGSSGYAKVKADDLKAWDLGAIYGKYIPLTPEILEKCGFKYWEAGHHSRQIDEYICLFIYPNGHYGFWSDSLENECVCTVRSQDNYIQHLHQLQNLYFALTGSELEIREL